jgi:UDP-N-acetylmuramyl tripeptide synthase
MTRLVFFRQIWKAYFVSYLVKLAKKGNSTSFPGLAIEKRYPGLLKDLTQDFEKVILISGTNGKTTTRAIINHFYQAQNIPICSNLGGANLVRGIATSLLLNRDFWGKPKSKIGVFEIEEASLPIITKYIKTDTLILTNLFRDQLDAYGEIDTTLDYFRKSLINLKFPFKNQLTNSDKDQKFELPELIINGEDGNLVDLVSEFGVIPKTFALDIKNDQKPRYESKFKAKNLNKITAVAKDITQNNLETTFEIKLFDETETIKTQLPGTYNIYNILAAYLATKSTFKEKIQSSLVASFKPAFGRGEKITIENQLIHLFLVKNPAGMDQVLNLIKDNFKDDPVNLAICINDNIADGKDISWLWDASLESFIKSQKIGEIYTAGTRGLDMLLRLEYSGLQVENSQNKETFSGLLEQIQDSKKEFLVLCNYTALLELRKLLATKTNLKDINEAGN